jgi:hypothetical protein
MTLSSPALVVAFKKRNKLKEPATIETPVLLKQLSRLSFVSVARHVQLKYHQRVARFTG